jgi:hypothetical protein
MNIETREIRNFSELSDDEKASGGWIPIAKKWAKKYTQKMPVSDADYARIMAADERRKRRAAKRGGGSV